MEDVVGKNGITIREIVEWRQAEATVHRRGW